MNPKITLSRSSRFLPLSEIFLVLLVSLVWWPCFIVLTLLNLTLRRIVQILYNTLHDNQTFLLASGEDSVFGYKVKGNCNSLIAGYQVIKGKPDLGLIQRKFQSVTSNKDFSRLSYSFTKKYGYFCWKRDQDFSVTNHIRRLDENLGRPLVESDLLSLVQSLVRQEMPDTRPQWEILLVPDYIHGNEEDQHYALIIRFNHAYSDAISFYLMLNEYVADTKASFPSNLNPFSNPFPIPFWGKLLIWTKAFFMGPYTFVKIMSIFIFDSSVFTAKYYEDEKLCGRSSNIKMSLLKELKRRTGASVTSLLYTVVYSALEKSHKRDFPSKSMPKDLHLGAVMAMFPYWTERKMGNQFTLWPYTAPLSVETNENPEKSFGRNGNLHERLQISHRLVQEALSGSGPLFNFYLARALGSIPVLFHSLLWQLSGSPVMLSNVPGVEERMRIFGGEIVDAAGFLPLMSTVGMGISTMTYAGDLRFNCIVDPQVYRTLPQLQRFLDDIVEDFYKLAEMYGVQEEMTVDQISSTDINENLVRSPFLRKIRPKITSQMKDLKDLNDEEIEEEREIKVIRRCIQSL